MDGKIEKVLERAKTDKVRLVELQFTDIFGIVKSVTIPLAELENSFKHGTNFDGSSIEGFARIHESDLVLRPDPETYALLPWVSNEHAECRFICDVYTPKGEIFEGAPRSVLRRAIEHAKELGYVFQIGTEQEFDMFPKEVLTNIDTLKTMVDGYGNYYFNFDHGSGTEVRRDIINGLETMGMKVEASHHEVAAKQHEIDIRYGEALSHADNAITLRYVVKRIASMHNKHATFMPKTRYGVNGVGMHSHISLADLKGDNIFYDSKDPYNLSEVAYNFMAGIFAHIKAITAITNPLVNSYKRITPGYEAPCYISWARHNRSALIRIPHAQKETAKKSTRMELRSPDPSCNPYLSFAVMLESGLDGIKRKLKPPAPIEENVFGFEDEELSKKGIETLPKTLEEAIKELEKDKVVQKALGSHVYENFVYGKMQEWDSFRTSVTDWEINRYFKVY